MKLDLSPKQAAIYEKIKTNYKKEDSDYYKKIALEIRAILGDNQQKRTVQSILKKLNHTRRAKLGDDAIRKALRELKEIEPRLRCKVAKRGRKAGLKEYWLAGGK